MMPLTGPVARIVTAIILTCVIGVGGPFTQPDFAAAKSRTTQDQVKAKKRGSSDKAKATIEKRLPARQPFTEVEQQSATIPGIPNARFWADSESGYRKALPPLVGEWLVLSSGGADGAFGAGVMAGLTASGRRPDFALVTGVSTGALMAPYLFLGPRYDKQLQAAYTDITAADVFELGGRGESFFDTWPLRDTIAKRLSPKMLAEIADEHRKGRRLFVVTSNLDADRPVAWDMGAIATAGGEYALRLFRDILLAATSVPGAFPPVLIEVRSGDRTFHEMHADGGLHNQFFIAPATLMNSASAFRPPATSIRLVINSSLEPLFSVTDRDTIAILNRAVATGVRTLTRIMIDLAQATATRNGIPLHLATIGPLFKTPMRSAFDTDYMKALFAFGFEQGKNGTAFRTIP